MSHSEFPGIFKNCGLEQKENTHTHTMHQKPKRKTTCMQDGTRARCYDQWLGLQNIYAHVITNSELFYAG